MRTSVKVANTRRVLCIFPAYSPAFGTFSHAFKLMPGVRAFMPPQGLLLVAAYMPAQWPVRFIDENIAPATRGDLTWAGVGHAYPGAADPRHPRPRARRRQSDGAGRSVGLRRAGDVSRRRVSASRR